MLSSSSSSRIWELQQQQQQQQQRHHSTAARAQQVGGLGWQCMLCHPTLLLEIVNSRNFSIIYTRC